MGPLRSWEEGITHLESNSLGQRPIFFFEVGTENSVDPGVCDNRKGVAAAAEKVLCSRMHCLSAVGLVEVEVGSSLRYSATHCEGQRANLVFATGPS